jgi:hypothetical protein
MDQRRRSRQTLQKYADQKWPGKMVAICRPNNHKITYICKVCGKIRGSLDEFGRCRRNICLPPTATPPILLSSNMGVGKKTIKFTRALYFFLSYIPILSYISIVLLLLLFFRIHQSKLKG